jgi:hypothetical protein
MLATPVVTPTCRNVGILSIRVDGLPKWGTDCNKT